MFTRRALLKTLGGLAVCLAAQGFLGGREKTGWADNISPAGPQRLTVEYLERLHAWALENMVPPFKCAACGTAYYVFIPGSSAHPTPYFTAGPDGVRTELSRTPQCPRCKCGRIVQT